MASVNGCTIAVEDVFGPDVSPSCLDGFDFTVLFEETILTLLPLGVFLLLAPIQVLKLRGEAKKVASSWLYWTKLVCDLDIPG